MFELFGKKSKIQAYDIIEVPIERFEILGIGQINPYCTAQYENEMFITVVNFAYESKQYDEKEGLVLSDYFALKKCPKCKKTKLVPVKIWINKDLVYQKHEEEIAYDAFEENPPLCHRPSYADAYCNVCSTCFEIKIKSKDSWVKAAKNIRKSNLINKSWNQYCIE